MIVMSIVHTLRAKSILHFIMSFSALRFYYLEFFTSEVEGLSFCYPGSIFVVSTFAWVYYLISRDRHEEAVDMISNRVTLLFMCTFVWDQNACQMF